MAECRGSFISQTRFRLGKSYRRWRYFELISSIQTRPGRQSYEKYSTTLAPRLAITVVIRSLRDSSYWLRCPIHFHPDRVRGDMMVWTSMVFMGWLRGGPWNCILRLGVYSHRQRYAHNDGETTQKEKWNRKSQRWGDKHIWRSLESQCQSTVWTSRFWLDNDWSLFVWIWRRGLENWDQSYVRGKIGETGVGIVEINTQQGVTCNQVSVWLERGEGSPVVGGRPHESGFGWGSSSSYC